MCELRQFWTVVLEAEVAAGMVAAAAVIDFSIDLKNPGKNVIGLIMVFCVVTYSGKKKK